MILASWILREHEQFFKDLRQLGYKELQIFQNKRNKIKTNPLRLKHLSGGNNTYREPLSNNCKLVYAVIGNEIIFLSVGPHDKAYKIAWERLDSLKFE